MSESREFNASTIENAVAKASADLEVSETDLSYEVVDEGSEGFLGIGARDARIRVFVPSETTLESTSVEPEATDSTDHLAEAELSGSSPSSESDDGSADVSSNLESEGIEETEDRDLTEMDSTEATNLETVEAPDWLLDEVRGYVSSVVDGMGLEARLDVYDTEECIAVDIVSDHTALIIGQKGETIDSLQYLTNSAIYRDRDFVKRIVLDSEGYRQRRIEAIQGMAHRTARKSIREQREVQMPPMNASERRVVHVYLRENPRVTTFSEGSGSERRITVAPS